MPREIIKYRCSICHSEYYEICSAEECEMKHFLPTGVVKYSSPFLDGKYPHVINVQLQNWNETLLVYGQYTLSRKPLIPGVDYPVLLER
jgi:hypothetical protein